MPTPKVNRQHLPPEPELGPGETRCNLCGNPVQQADRNQGPEVLKKDGTPKRKAGRTREWCSADCREAAAALTVAEQYISYLEDRATPQAWLQIRGRLQGMAAHRPWNKGIRIPVQPSQAQPEQSEEMPQA